MFHKHIIMFALTDNLLSVVRAPSQDIHTCILMMPDVNKVFVLNCTSDLEYVIDHRAQSPKFYEPSRPAPKMDL